MCGRFTQQASWRELVAFSQPLTVDPNAETVFSTPMRDAFVIHLDDDGKRATTGMRWGFAEKNARSPGRPKHMHARAETIDALPTFADSFAKRRGIIVVADFNVGEALPNGKTKQWRITPNDSQPLAFAVIYEEWTNDAERLWSFVQATVPSNALIAPVTDRMPAILRPEDWPLWLGETNAPIADVKALLQTLENPDWTMAPQSKPAKPKPAGPQADLF